MVSFDAPDDASLTAYSHLSHLFLELRGRGVTLSSIDLEILWHWRIRAIPPDLIERVMLEMADECIKARRPFPSSLVSVNRRVQALLRDEIL